MNIKLKSCVPHGTLPEAPGRSGVGGYSTKSYTGRLHNCEVQPLTLLYTVFDRKGTPFVHLPFKNGTPFTYHCISFNCWKCTIFWNMSKSQNPTFLQLFHSQKIHLLALAGLCTVTEMADSTTLSYTSASYIPTHWYTWSLKNVPFQARPPCKGYYREYHLQLKVAFYTFDLRQVYIVQDSYSLSFFFSLEFLSSLPIPNACK